MSNLSNKRILLGVTGGIAAYKSAELTRLLRKAKAELRVVMTRAAVEFITPLTLQALSGNRVHQELLDSEAEAAMGHIELARWAELILVAPASADCIANISHGQAHDLLTASLLAADAPIAIAPAMNQAMWENAATRHNVQLLQSRGIHVWGPAKGEQACGDLGPGRMLEPQQLVEHCAAMFDPGFLVGCKLVITGGPTREALDPVRFLSNRSSGKMAFALAGEAARAGARVTLISGPVALTTPPAVTRLEVTDARQMHTEVLRQVSDADVFIGAAAVADYRPEKTAGQKLKKGKQTVQLELVQNPDIISEVANLPRPPLVVGFAAETENMIANACDKLTRKKLDLVFANHAPSTFDSDTIAVTAIGHDSRKELESGSKQTVARHMLRLIGDLWCKRSQA